ncbi:O-antigen ligase family protein [Flavobacterium enshiense]|uniref:O-antigen ligase-related domain-containing protein n=1 Tax=Flavobacterium enshiense DK69 TaxID=1107311 RepID=A0A0A2MV00_9FLAO|nr:O-antigen ligase family protein [Flavobacterium enshiense]KGO95451.1 hypothetical protein Q767_11655 [Flavobacterium enshiense DK69]
MSVLAKNNLEKVLLVLVPLLFAFPLFKESLSTFFFILLSVAALIYVLLTKKHSLILKDAIYLSIPFWIILIRCILDFSSANDLGPAKNALFFLLFPIIFSLLPQKAFTKEKLNFYLNILKNVCALISIAYIILFLYYYDFEDFFRYTYNIPKFRDFVYNETPFFKIHPTYFTSFVFLCCAFSLDNILKRKKYFEILYILVFIAITLMLLVKINILLLFILISATLLFRTSLNLKQKIALFAGFTALISTMIIVVPGIKGRFTEIIESYNRPPSGLAYDSTNIRVAIVGCSMELVKENYIEGLGFSHLGPALEECFSRNYETDFYVGKNYLTHNYFLYILISSGIIGFVFFLYFVYRVIRYVLHINCFILSVSMANIFILNLTEDFFYRQYGLFFFCLIFYTFFKTKDNTPDFNQV